MWRCQAAIAVVDHPMSPMTAGSGTPRTSSTVAAVWRTSCRRPSRNLASVRSAFHSDFENALLEVVTLKDEPRAEEAGYDPTNTPAHAPAHLGA